MTDAELLLAACRRTPDDDTPRLVLADRLQEDGFDGAAQFIRTEIKWFREGKPARIMRKANVQSAGGYVAWLSSLFPLDAVVHHGGTQFIVFQFEPDNRRTVIHIERGLPLDLVSTAPHFMDRAAALFRFPIREALLSDRRPIDGGPHYPRNFVWVRAAWPQKFNTWEESPHEIPAPLFDRLSLATGTHAGAYRRGHYPSRAQAQIALSLAARAHGEALVASDNSGA